MNVWKMPSTSSRSPGSSDIVQAVRTVDMVLLPPLPELRSAPADERQVAVVGPGLAPEQLHHALGDLPARRRAAQLVVVAGDEDLRGVRVLLEHLVRREVRQGLRVVAVDVDLVDAELVVLPDHRAR